MDISKIGRSGFKFIRNKDYRFLIMTGLGFYDKLPDDEYIRRKFKAIMGKDLELENPQTFNEKLQWLKLHDRHLEYTMMVDKYAVRQYIADTIGEEYLIPLLGVWDEPDEIDFKALPNQFVLKCNHNSGLGMIICKDKSKLNVSAVKKELRKGLKQDYYLTGREWPYKNVSRKIIAERYIEDDSGELQDFKLMCFNGKVKCSFVCSNRFSKDGLHVTFFDLNWKVMPFERHYPYMQQGMIKPKNYNVMIKLAEKLSHGCPFVRADFYNIGGRIYFGELTFFPGGGFEEFTPEEWDYKFGSWIELPKGSCL